ncbi:Sin3 family co-repressor-domain-containing protein, partial [Mucor lusitanicus]
YRPLNVKDALTYLDTVKAKFSSRNDVYNQFLDIMKDFKSQMIDTPGVIERVSTLFRGHPALISGFNTFLPPGYRIECSIDDQERNIIKVTTPTGTTCITESESLNLRGDDSFQPQQEDRKAPVEFNHAITYVNKIKNRFAGQPDTYKKFLEILQTYQKDQKPISEVYTEVQALFDGSTELLEEFKQFLPEPKQRKKRSGQIPNLSISKVGSNITKHHHKTDLQTSNVRGDPSNSNEHAASSSSSLNDDLSRPTFSAEEAEFFEKVKTYIGNKATYNAFLKVLNLFSQQIVDQNVLVSRVESFIGGNMELFEWFKSLVGYDGTDQVIENTPRMQPVTKNAGGCGPSYRHVPKAWQNRTCSGRDALCWDVLNDTYISHPTWASEDTGYVASKKNQYEEALHRVEEERYDYDLNIEANLNTIALLEPIAKKISIMTAEEKSSFRLSPGLGSPSRTIYQRIMKKIYASKGLEMIDLLHNNPAQTVPIVLKRLKQKDDEWKRAQREWNKIWREVEVKNYWKSLDYQGITFKLTDRKAMTTRSLVAEAEDAKEAHKEDKFQFEFPDAAVFKDVSRLVYFYLDRQPVYNPEDCASMRVFMNTMIPLFFNVNDVEPSTVDSADIVMEEILDDDASSVQSDNEVKTTATSTARATNRRPRRARGQLNDDDGLLKDVLTRNIKKKKPGRSTSSKKKAQTTATTPPKMTTLASLIEKEKSLEPENQKTYNFYGDSGFYCFFRLYRILYDRLCKMKALDAEFRANPEKARKAHKEARDLGITPKGFKGKSLKMDTKRGYYSILLSLIDKLFEGEIDQQTFEECVRYIFGADAYIMFTIDKLVLSLVRDIHIIIADTQSQELYELFKIENRAEQMDQGDPTTYRTRVAGIIDPTENTYHITFKLKSRTLAIKLLDGTHTVARESEGCGGYDEYVANYIDWANETKGINQASLTPRFLKRFVQECLYHHS